MFISKVKTDIVWIKDIAETPLLGEIFIFTLAFVPAVLCSFAAQAFIPSLNDDNGFTKAMLVFLPGLNLVMWLSQIKLYLFFLPSWILLGGISVLKATIMFLSLGG